MGFLENKIDAAQLSAGMRANSECWEVLRSLRDRRGDSIREISDFIMRLLKELAETTNRLPAPALGKRWIA